MAQKGDIVKILFPFTNFKESKERFAVVLYANPANEDIVVAAITSQPWTDIGDFLLKSTEPEFKLTNLKTDSYFRIGKLVTIHQDCILEYTGKIGKKTEAKINDTIKQLFQV